MKTEDIKCKVAGMKRELEKSSLIMCLMLHIPSLNLLYPINGLDLCSFYIIIL